LATCCEVCGRETRSSFLQKGIRSIVELVGPRPKQGTFSAGGKNWSVTKGEVCPPSPSSVLRRAMTNTRRDQKWRRLQTLTLTHGPSHGRPFRAMLCTGCVHSQMRSYVDVRVCSDVNPKESSMSCPRRALSRDRCAFSVSVTSASTCLALDLRHRVPGFHVDACD
jgi:hypothetical protein